MHFKRLLLFLVSILTLLASDAFGQDFYDPSYETRDVIVDLQLDYGADGLGTQDDSAKLQSAIDFVSGEGGGVVSIPLGLYQLASIQLKSNVQIEIEKDTVITVFISPGDPKSVKLFQLGGILNQPIVNVSVEGVGGRFSVITGDHVPGVSVFTLKRVTNFFISNVDIFDQITKFSSFGFSPGLKNPTDGASPLMGTISNASSFGAAYGYGLVQVQSATSVNFRNLYTLGGVALRVETGWALMNDLQIPGTGAFNIIGEDLTSEDGNAAFMISPHSMHNGVVQVDGVTSIGAGFAVRIGGGFVSNKQTNPNLVDGTFAEGCSVINITASYGENAQLKSKHFQYMPTELLGLIQDMSQSEDGSSVRGPAIAPVLYTPNYPIEVCNVSGTGFLFNPPIVPEGAYVKSPVLLGDCNLDDVVDFLDIAPFIASLTSATFLEQADCNQDDVLNFLDISPFIGILSGN